MFKRLRMIFRSMFGWALRKVEDPELILRQHIDDLRSRIPEFNRQAAEVVKLEKMLAMQADRLRKKVSDLEAQVVAAVKLGPSKKEVAKSLIAALETAKLDLAETEQQLAQARANSEQVKRARLAYERKVQQQMQEAMRQISRAKRAEMQKQMASMMMSFEVNDDSDVLDRMTEKIDEDLARAEARTEIAQESVSSQLMDVEAAAVDQQAESRYEEYARQLGVSAGSDDDVVQKTLDSISADLDQEQQTT
jgi:phage shock protein A